MDYYVTVVSNVTLVSDVTLIVDFNNNAWTDSGCNSLSHFQTKTFQNEKKDVWGYKPAVLWAYASENFSSSMVT